MPASPASPAESRPGFGGVVGETYRDSVPDWAVPAGATGRPNVVVVVLDDLGFGSLGCFGSEIRTPTIDRLAAEGVRFTNFHATALCSPTRASLLTGRNHHAVGMAYLSHVDDGYPGYRGRITHRAGTLAEILRDAGWNTMAAGKWHLAPMDETTAAGPFDQWPLGRGFERYYGFLEGLTDHYHPELYQDNQQVAAPSAPEDGYHLTADLVDRSIAFVRNQQAVTPEKPFFLYLAFGATHTPFQAPPDLVAAYRGAYDAGWDEIRAARYRRQLAEGIVPPGTRLVPRNEGVEAWDDLAPEQQRLYARFQEVYAAFLEHTDRELGRLVAALETLGRLDDTVVVVLSDNGASQEGGPHGVLDTTSYENGRFPSLAENLARADEIDGRTAHVNYPLGWAQAGNTPLKHYKQNTHAGGIRTPMVLRLPGGRAGGRTVARFQHVTDVAPTVLDLVGVPPPDRLGGREQLPFDGRSLCDVLDDPDAAPPPRTQYFETVGHRAVVSDGWKAVAKHVRGADFATDRWELYHLDADFSEYDDLAEREPGRLASLVDRWWQEARKHQVLPLDDRGFAERATVNVRPGSPRDRDRFTYLRGTEHVGTGAAPVVAGRPHTIRADVRRDTPTANGVLLAHGSVNSGYAVLLDDAGHLAYHYNRYGRHTVLRSREPVPVGAARVEARFRPTGEGTAAHVSLAVDGTEVAATVLPETFEHFVAFQGLDVGRDGLSPVRGHGAGPSPFTGSFDAVVVEVAGGTPHGVHRSENPD